jgi:uncharacterized protein (TIGR03083 family)
MPAASSISPMRSITKASAVEALAAEYGLISEIVSALSPVELAQWSGCAGWTNADLIFHMLLDAQRALVALNSPGSGPVDRDFVTYWEGFVATDEGSRDHARFVRINAASHRDPTTIGSRWVGTAGAAVRNARTSEVDPITTQGHVLTAADFIATLVVEATIHHLDLVANLAGKSAPAAEAASLTTATLDGLLNVPQPAHWSGETYILKATGRAPLTVEDRTVLGAASDRIPVFS